tara:strand:+ start:1122 stop:1856 length:735 start_codon:yes stop_codon:yes gene_type:complete
MDIRQIVMVSRLRDPLINELCELFEFEVAFNDPGVGHFGLENAVIPIGKDFLEVVSPVQEGTTAERFINKRNGDGGYMIIIQVDDFQQSKALVSQKGIDIVWETDLPEAKAIHLHPKQTGGAILSLDWMDPKDSWKWAGPNWTDHISGPISGVEGVEIQSNNPQEMFETWSQILGNPRMNKEDGEIYLNNTWIKFILDLDGRGPGVSSFILRCNEIERIQKKAEALQLLHDDAILLGGVKFYLK